jgi:ribonuclease HI
LEKTAYAVVMAARKLRHYFEGHRIRVIMNQPLNDLFTNKEASTQIIKWGVELSEYTVDFERRSAIKSQVLADFVVDWTLPTHNPGEDMLTPWVVQCDGAWCHKGVGISVVVTSPTGIVIRYAARLIFVNDEHSTNNTTEYEALLLALRKMKALSQQTFIIKTDSKVIQEHIEKESEARNPILMKYLEKVREMERHFKGYLIQHIPRDDNNEVDKLAKAAARNQVMPPDVFFEIIKESCIKETKPKIVNIVETCDWIAEIMAYLRGHYEPQDELEEKRLKQRSRGYAVVNGELYKSGVTEPWLRCITSEKGVELLKEIHSGFCGAHIGTRALADKVTKQGFYWTTINIDAKKLVWECEACQKTANQQNLPSMPVHLIPPSWPLQRWEMDLVGPLPTAQGNCKFAVVVVDYFTKWVEAKALVNITAPTIQKFFWQNIVCRFGVPRELTVNNGKQFDCYPFKEYCKTLGTHAKYSSVYHPLSNGAVERPNGLIFSGIKKCLFDQKKGKWTDELPKVNWSHNTTVSRATSFTPFLLLFGTEAMTPEEIKNESMKT